MASGSKDISTFLLPWEKLTCWKLNMQTGLATKT